MTKSHLGGGNIYAFDPTPKSIRFVEEHPLSKNERFHFYPIGLSDKDEAATFYLPENDDYVSGSVVASDGYTEKAIQVQMECLSTIAHKLGHDHIDLLKMDVEGSEFAIIEHLHECDIPISQICVETHDRFFDDGLDRLDRMIGQLHAMGYKAVARPRGNGGTTFVHES